MRRDANLKRRLTDVRTLQVLRTAASRATLGDAQAATAEAARALTERKDALDEGARQLEAVRSAEMLDLDRWRIGGALLERLAAAHDATAGELAECEDEERTARNAFGHERNREDRAAAMLRDTSRRLSEKQDEAAVVEASALAALRKAMGAR